MSVKIVSKWKTDDREFIDVVSVSLLWLMWRCDCDSVYATIFIVTSWLTCPVTFVGFFLAADLNCFADSFVIILFGFVSRYTQGVIRVRKRVTLMVVTVTVMFGVCWVSDIIAHSVDYYTSLSTSKDIYAVIHTLVLLNAAVNPFVYALINRTFRDKIKEMIRCSFTKPTGSWSTPARVPQNAEFANKEYRKSSVWPSSSEWA